MQSMSWTPGQSEALRAYVVAGLSFSQAAEALNARFGTAYTRNAIIGRARRMKLAARAGAEGRPQPRLPMQGPAKAAARGPGGGGRALGAARPAQPSEPVRLICVGIQPRLLPLEDLGRDDCRYPYGGDKEGEAIAFCGHPRHRGSSYCAPHFHLTRGPRIAPDRPAGPIGLRLVGAA